MAHQNPFGGAPRIGNAAEGEPEAPGGSVSQFGGGPSLVNQNVERGNAQLNAVRNDVYPEVYGGGEQLGNKIKGGGNTTGGGRNVGQGDIGTTTTGGTTTNNVIP